MKKEATENARLENTERIKKAQRAIDRFQSGNITGKQFRNELKCLRQHFKK